MDIPAAEGRVCLSWLINLCGRLNCSHVHLKREIMDPALPPHSSHSLVSCPFQAKIIPSGEFLMEQKAGKGLPQVWAGVKPLLMWISISTAGDGNRRSEPVAKAVWWRVCVVWGTLSSLPVGASFHGVMGMECRDPSRALGPAGALRQSSPGVSSGGLTLPIQGLSKHISVPSWRSWEIHDHLYLIYHLFCNNSSNNSVISSNNDKKFSLI